MKVKVSKDTEIVVVGDIHEHEDQFLDLLKDVSPTSRKLIVSVGDVYDKGKGREAGDRITKILSDLHQIGTAYVVKGNHELKAIKKNRSSELEWWSKQPLAIMFEFEYGGTLTVVHGGILPSHLFWDQVIKDVTVCYVRDLDPEGKMIKLIWVEENGKKALRPSKPNGIPWHQKYDGRFGFIAAGHDPQRNGQPKFYNFSCNLDTAVYQTGTLTAKVFKFSGLGETLQYHGKAYGQDYDLSLS